MNSSYPNTESKNLSEGGGVQSIAGFDNGGAIIWRRHLTKEDDGYLRLSSDQEDDGKGLPTLFSTS